MTRSHAFVPVAVVALLVAALAAPLRAEPPMPPMPPGAPMPPPRPGMPGPPGDDPIGERLFPPDLIMQHQSDIGLDDKQRAAIVDEMSRFQSTMVKLQWDMRAAGEQLAHVLDNPNVDENKALAQADKLMSLEHDMKKAHLTLLIHLKNRLTPDQQKILRAKR